MFTCLFIRTGYSGADPEVFHGMLLDQPPSMEHCVISIYAANITAYENFMLISYILQCIPEIMPHILIHLREVYKITPGILL